jgi:branched-chain amino acid transport system permease protein
LPDLTPYIGAGLALGSVYALSGVGLVVLFRSTGVINFAYGAVGAIGALAAWSIGNAGAAPAVTWLAAIGISVSISVTYGSLIAPRLATRDATVQSATTLGLMLVLLGVAGLLWPDDAPRSFSLPTDTTTVQLFGVRFTGTQILALGICAATTVSVGFLLRRTRGGLALRAMAADRELSGLLGVEVTRLGAASWALSGAMAGVAGLLLADLVELDATTLTFFVIQGIAAATIGRFWSLQMTVLGGLVVGVVEAIATPINSITNYRSVLPFLLAIIWLLVSERRQGRGVRVAVSR